MSARALLETGLAALPCPLPAQLPEQLWQYLMLLEKWNAVHNLTAVRNAEEQVRLHLLDCLAVVPLLDADLTERHIQAAQIADIGSGAGLPGLIWAMARPEWQLYLVESQGKKAAFLREVQRVLGLKNVQVMSKRAEQWQAPVALDWIVSRAVAEIDGFLRFTAHLGKASSRWGLMKAHDDELCTLAGFVKAQVQAVNVPLLEAPRLWISLRQEAAYGN